MNKFLSLILSIGLMLGSLAMGQTRSEQVLGGIVNANVAADQGMKIASTTWGHGDNHFGGGNFGGNHFGGWNHHSNHHHYDHHHYDHHHYDHHHHGHIHHHAQ